MRVFAISDLHLPGGEKKPMDIFGAHWAGHFDRIRADWTARVAEGDLVLIAGDISWAMRLDAAREDLSAIGRLPGNKVILRGNHDYWWSSISQVRGALPEGMYALQNDALSFGDIILCGTRGWTCPGAPAFTQADEKLYRRELSRLRMSLSAAEALRAARLSRGENPWLIAMLHYPPFPDPDRPGEVSALLEAAGVSDVIYGHLHGQALLGAFSGEKRGVRYHQTSCDGLDFRLHALSRDQGPVGF